MSQVKYGDTVKVHYTGTLDDGTVFDTSIGGDPVKFTIGEGTVIPGFEEAVLGMGPGESKVATIASGRAYGPYRDEMIVDIDRTLLPTDLEPEVGQHLQIFQESDQSAIVTVLDVSDSAVTIDANHPLAGHDLTFEIKLVEIQSEVAVSVA